MSTLKVDNIRHNNATTDALVLSNDGSVAIGTCTAKLTDINGGGLSHRNVVINGAMTISQRGNQGTTSAAGYFACDRFFISNGSGAQVAVNQSTNKPDGFSHSLHVDCQVADTSIANNEYFLIQHRIEGYETARFAKGSSAAKQYALSFHLRSDKTGIYTVELEDVDNGRICSKTINVPNTAWNRYTIIYPADTTGAHTIDNSSSLTINWWLASGSDYNSGTLQSSAWGTRTNANRVSSSNVNFFDSTDNDFRLTGVQLEVGDTVTSFEHRPHSEELLRCQRYFKRMRGAVGGGGGYGSAGDGAVCTMANWTNTAAYGLLPLGVEMRYAPKLTGFSNLNYFSAGNTWAPGSTSQCYLAGSSYDRVELTLQGMSNMSQGNAGWLRIDNPSGYMDFDAEL